MSHTEVHFGGCLYITDLIKALEMERVTILCPFVNTALTQAFRPTCGHHQYSYGYCTNGISISNCGPQTNPFTAVLTNVKR